MTTTQNTPRRRTKVAAAAMLVAAGAVVAGALGAAAPANAQADKYVAISYSPETEPMAGATTTRRWTAPESVR